MSSVRKASSPSSTTAWIDEANSVAKTGFKSSPGERDDRIIWRLVKEVAAKANVTTHVHALRSAFAVQYLESNLGDIDALRELMGHTRGETKQVYLRRLNRRRRMDSVRGLSWASVPTQIAQKLLEANPLTEKEGFEPSMEEFTPITP